VTPDEAARTLLLAEQFGLQTIAAAAHEWKSPIQGAITPTSRCESISTGTGRACCDLDVAARTSTSLDHDTLGTTPVGPLPVLTASCHLVSD
jgi:hypothetical protein